MKKTTLLSNIHRWLDSWALDGAVYSAPEQINRVDPFRLIPFFIIHGGLIGLFFVGWSWPALATAAALYFIRMFAITGFYHRYFSHRSFKTTRAFQFIMGVWGNSAAQRGPLWWAAHHRHHHRHSDQELDVHSPHQHSFLWSHMLWIASESSFKTQLHEVRDLVKYPELRFLDRFDQLTPLALIIALYFYGMALNIFFPSLGTSGWQMVIWGFFVSTFFLFHGTSTINSLSHMFGRKRYKTRDESKNNFWLAMITLGEGWHNNHHYYPASTRQGFYWWEIDITYYILKGFAALGIIWDLKPVPEHVRNSNHLSEAPPAEPKAA